MADTQLLVVGLVSVAAIFIGLWVIRRLRGDGPEAWALSLIYVAAYGVVLAATMTLMSGRPNSGPTGQEAVIPSALPGRTVHLVPLGDYPISDVEALADYFAARYDLRIELHAAVAIPEAARDDARGQLIAEELIAGMRATLPAAGDSARVVIGITGEDLYSRARPDWAWAFGLRTDGHLAVISSARMRILAAEELADARLRKMVSKYIGLLYYGLQESTDPRSVMYGNILGVRDLDRMGDDY